MGSRLSLGTLCVASAQTAAAIVASDCGSRRQVFDQGVDMPASRRPARAARRPVAAASATETPLENRLKQEITVAMKQRLGLDERDKVPAKIQGLVDSAAREVAESSMASSVMQEVENVTRRLARSWPDDQVAEAVTNFSELELLEEAEYLAAKKKALQAAGFSGDEAMRILVAGVTAGSSQASDS
jgi:hypothetical protein